MDNIITLVISVLVAVIVAYNVVLPVMNRSIELQTNTTPSDMAWSNLTAGNLALSRVISTLVVTLLVVFIVRNLLSG